MPTKIIANLETGTITEVELEGEELAAYEAALLAQQNEPEVTQEPTLAEIVSQLQAEIAALKAGQ